MAQLDTLRLLCLSHLAKNLQPVRCKFLNPVQWHHPHSSASPLGQVKTQLRGLVQSLAEL